MKTFFSSDYHLGHKNIIKHDNRPFGSVEEMDETIIANHNAVISSEDDFYFLGDFVLDDRLAENYLSQLNGNLFFIRGNHDTNRTVTLYHKYGLFLGDLKMIDVENQKIVLCHYALKVWNKAHIGAWHLYGHSHQSLPDDSTSLSMDVGINHPLFNYTPIEFGQVAELMAQKEYKPVDHHR